MRGNTHFVGPIPRMCISHFFLIFFFISSGDHYIFHAFFCLVSSLTTERYIYTDLRFCSGSQTLPFWSLVSPLTKTLHVGSTWYFVDFYMNFNNRINTHNSSFSLQMTIRLFIQLLSSSVLTKVHLGHLRLQALYKIWQSFNC